MTKGGKGDKVANGAKVSVVKEALPLELRVEQGMSSLLIANNLEVCGRLEKKKKKKKLKSTQLSMTIKLYPAYMHSHLHTYLYI